MFYNTQNNLYSYAANARSNIKRSCSRRRRYRARRAAAALKKTNTSMQEYGFILHIEPRMTTFKDEDIEMTTVTTAAAATINEDTDMSSVDDDDFPSLPFLSVPLLPLLPSVWKILKPQLTMNRRWWNISFPPTRTQCQKREAKNVSSVICKFLLHIFSAFSDTKMLIYI